MNANDESEGSAGWETALGHLPVPLTRLVGREDELSVVRSLGWRTRLLTLCGPEIQL